MKLSKLWLHDWVKFSLSEQELANQLTMAGLEVDAISPVAGRFNQVVVAKVLSTKAHPNADKLTLCEVDANTDKPLQIVCGASNVRPGLKVALAMIGAELPGDFKIKESKLRGELSQGMLCSASELGLAEQSEGILELDEDAPIGMDFRGYLQLDDCILDVDLTPNRADCFSVLGIAREVAVLNALPLHHFPVVNLEPQHDAKLAIHIENPAACPRYAGRIIRQINNNAVTPLWMRERLRRCGIRTLHLVVDVMNYVMLELGQPMHAFDLATIKGDIHVRMANKGESLALLDGQQVELNEQVLVIADSESVLAMAGIMGGADSAVQAETRDVFLESAFFSPVHLAGIARQFGLFTESSLRFERGVDPQLQIKALERASELIISIAGGEVGPIVERVETNYLPPQVKLRFDTQAVKKLTGLSIAFETIKTLLEGVGMVIEKAANPILELSVPSHRFDVQLDVDLVEEVIRLYGYDKLQAKPMNSIVQAGTTCDNERMTALLSHWFCARGYQESISYSFVDPQIQEILYPQAEFLQLLNPISSELSQMRAGLWPGLLASMVYNLHRQQTKIKLFEIGTIFHMHQGELSEHAGIAGLIAGMQGDLNWSEVSRTFDFYDLKGDLGSLFASLQLPKVEFIAAEHPALHPGQAAKIMQNGQHAGWIGTLHPRLSDELDIQHDAILFELRLAALINPQAPRYSKISKYPQIRRDLSFLVDKHISALEIETAVRKTITENWLQRFDVFDVYTGTGVPEGKKSLAIAITLQDENRTLADTEINPLISAIIKVLETNFSILLRD